MTHVVIKELVNPRIRIVHVVITIIDSVKACLRAAKDLTDIVSTFDTSRCEAVNSSRQVDNQANHDQLSRGFHA